MKGKNTVAALKSYSNELELIRSEINNKSRILVLGCQDMNIIKRIFRISQNLDCIDKDFDNVKNAKKQIKNISYSITDLESIKKKDFYDIIIDLDYLHHTQQKYWRSYFIQLLKLLKTNGKYIFRVYSKNAPQVRNYHPKRQKRNWNYSYGVYDHFFTEKSIKRSIGRYIPLKSISEISSKKESKSIRFIIGSAQLLQKKLDL